MKNRDDILQSIRDIMQEMFEIEASEEANLYNAVRMQSAATVFISGCQLLLANQQQGPPSQSSVFAKSIGLKEVAHYRGF
jgi:hypothetical protein